MEYYGEYSFDWGGLRDAGNFITRYCYKRAYLSLIWKEKHGEIIFEYLDASLFSYPVQSIFYPGHLYYRLPKYIRKIDNLAADVLIKYGISNLITKYQLYIFKKAIHKAMNKWPHLKDNISQDAFCLLGIEENE